MSQRCETEWQRVFQRHRCHNLTLEFRQWFLNPLLGRTFGIVRYRSTWMEEMNNRGVGIFVDFSYTKGISDILSKTCHEVRQGTWMLQPAGERWKQNTLRQKGAKSTGNWVQFMWSQEAPGKEKENRVSTGPDTSIRQLYSSFSSLADVSYRVIKDSLSWDELLQNNRKKDLSWIPRTHIKTKPGVMEHTCNLNTEEGETSTLLGLAGQTT